MFVTHLITSLMRSVHFDKMNDSYCCWRDREIEREVERERERETETDRERERVKAVLIIDVILADTELM